MPSSCQAAVRNRYSHTCSSRSRAGRRIATSSLEVCCYHTCDLSSASKVFDPRRSHSVSYDGCNYCCLQRSPSGASTKATSVVAVAAAVAAASPRLCPLFCGVSVPPYVDPAPLRTKTAVCAFCRESLHFQMLLTKRQQTNTSTCRYNPGSTNRKHSRNEG